MQHQNRELSVPTHAPDNIGFIHTSPDQFTHFTGSGAGARTTFGLSCEELLALFETVYKDFLTQQSKFADQDASIKELLTQFRSLQTILGQLVRDYKAERLYTDNTTMSEALVKSGHIPILLSGANAAIQYERAARDIRPYHLSEYFSSVPFAASQCREYLVKQDMMKAIAEFRSDVIARRYQLGKQGGMPFYFCNVIVNTLDEKVIKPNQLSLPREYAQFDLYETFRKTVFGIMCGMANVDANRKFFAQIEKLFDVPLGTSFEALQNASQKIYGFIHEYLLDNVGITADTQDMTLKGEQDKRLEDILPLIAYMNSEKNPFARNGVFGKEASTAFHREALEMYRRHESQTHGSPAMRGQFTYQQKAKENVRFDDDQLEILLFGKEEAKPASMFASMGSAMMGMLTQGTAAAAASSQPTQTEQRRAALALPMPREYLALMPPAAPAPKPPAAAASAYAPPAPKGPGK